MKVVVFSCEGTLKRVVAKHHSRSNSHYVPFLFLKKSLLLRVFQAEEYSGCGWTFTSLYIKREEKTRLIYAFCLFLHHYSDHHVELPHPQYNHHVINMTVRISPPPSRRCPSHLLTFCSSALLLFTHTYMNMHTQHTKFFRTSEIRNPALERKGQ